MIQSKPYEFMVTYTPQSEWIKRRGILLLLAFFFLELGAGTFIVCSIAGSWPGLLIGWLMCALLGGGFHLLYLGHPFRFWRIVLSSGWKTSWISRGLIFAAVFLVLGAIDIILIQLGASLNWLQIIANIFAFGTVIYVGFVMNYVNGIRLWNTPLLPVLYMILGIWGGLGITLISLLASGQSSTVGSLEIWSRIFLLAFIFIVFIYFLGIRYQGTGGKVSIDQIVRGKMAPIFWVMVVALAMVLPVGVAIISWLLALEIAPVLLYIVIIFELLGDLALRYCILSCGFYEPIVATNKYT